MEFLKTENIVLRELEPEDLEHLYRWENDTALWPAGDSTSPFSRYVLKEYIAQSHKTIYETHQQRFIIERRSDGTPLGTADLLDFDPFHNRAAVGLLVDPHYQHRGYGGEALRLLINYAFGFLSINQLYAHIALDNETSSKLLKSNGFVRCGLLKSWVRRGNDFFDVELVQLLAPVR